MGDAVAAVEESKGGVKAERTIDFKLFLSKHLVRAWSREGSRRGVFYSQRCSRVFIARERRFDVNKYPLAASWISDLPNRTMGTVMLGCISLLVNFLAGVEALVGYLLPRQVYLDAEVDQRTLRSSTLNEPNAICRSASASTAIMTRQRTRKVS